MSDDRYDELILMAVQVEKGACDTVSWVCSTLFLVICYTEAMPTSLRWILGGMMGAMAVKSAYHSTRAARVLKAEEKEGV